MRREQSVGLNQRFARVALTGLASIALMVGAFGARPAGMAQDAPRGASATAVRVFVQETDNLQWMVFWVAEGAGLFRREGLDVKVVTGNGRMLLQGQADVAIMPRPMFVTFVGEGADVVVFANLLANDPINLVVSRAVAEARGVTREMPLAERLRTLRGLRVGVAPGPPPRLRALYESVGLDAARDIAIVIIEGDKQSAAFADGSVDALYAHTPYLERALDAQGAVMIVNQSSGEVPALVGRQIHMAVTTRAYTAQHPDVVVAFTRALSRSLQLIHADRQAAVRAIQSSSVQLQEPKSVRTIVNLYEPAIPRTLEVSPAGAVRELELFPDRRRRPDLSGVDLAAHVDNRFAIAAASHRR